MEGISSIGAGGSNRPWPPSFPRLYRNVLRIGMCSAEAQPQSTEPKWNLYGAGRAPHSLHGLARRLLFFSCRFLWVRRALVLGFRRAFRVRRGLIMCRCKLGFRTRRIRTLRRRGFGGSGFRLRRFFMRRGSRFGFRVSCVRMLGCCRLGRTLGFRVGRSFMVRTSDRSLLRGSYVGIPARTSRASCYRAGLEISW